MTEATPLLEIERLRKDFMVRRSAFQRQPLHAVSDVSLRIRAGENVGLVGESGCGKTTLARCILGLERVTSGSIRYRGERIDHLSARAFRPYRSKIQIVFQDPTDSLNPRLTVRQTLIEPLQRATPLRGEAIEERLRQTIALVGLGDEHLARYPHQLSTGQQQRVGIARAVVSEPDFVVLDEPTSALDISVRGRVLELLANLQERLNMTYLLISHDLSTVRRVTQRTLIMYLGKVLEVGPTRTVFDQPVHPYTQALLSAIPSIEARGRRERILLSGEIPSPLNPPSGCVFHTCCELAKRLGNPGRCRSEAPQLRITPTGSMAACHFSDDALNPPPR
jgi:peptide/nickel transport system ATP-binding protein